MRPVETQVQAGDGEAWPRAVDLGMEGSGRKSQGGVGEGKARPPAKPPLLSRGLS